MIWLRNLKKVKEELRSERWPRSAQEGFYTGTVLMAHALEQIRKDIKTRMPCASDTRIELEFSRMLIRFNRMDERWIKKQKLDYEKIRNK
jgi:hypothetical protein